MGVNIAIVDDDELVRVSVAGLLRSYGVRTAAFESADALLVADCDKFDCVVSDLQMPGTNGIELSSILRDRPTKVPVIIMTAFPERANDARRRGDCFCLIEKPVDSGELISCIEQAIGRSLS